MLKVNSSLVLLYLQTNQLRTVDEIGEALKTNTCLQKLSLGGNSLVDVSCLGEVLGCNSVLEKLGLDCNKIVVCLTNRDVGANVRMCLVWDEGCEGILGYSICI